MAIGVAADQIARFQRLYKVDSAFNLMAPNPSFVGSLLDQGHGFGLEPLMLTRPIARRDRSR